MLGHPLGLYYMHSTHNDKWILASQKAFKAHLKEPTTIPIPLEILLFSSRTIAIKQGDRAKYHLTAHPGLPFKSYWGSTGSVDAFGRRKGDWVFYDDDMEQIPPDVRLTVRTNTTLLAFKDKIVEWMTANGVQYKGLSDPYTTLNRRGNKEQNKSALFKDGLLKKHHQRAGIPGPRLRKSFWNT